MQTKIAFLFLGQTHDDYSDVACSLAKQGLESQLIHLNDIEQTDWQEYRLVIVRECRGYHRYGDFLSKIENLQTSSGNTPIVNSLNIIRAAIDKGIYLRELEQQGIDIIPTLWLKRAATTSLEDIFQLTGWKDIVIKPTISSKCWNTFRIIKATDHITVIKAENKTETLTEKLTDEETPAFLKRLNTQDLCVQKFMPDILTTGETSFIFINGRFSHAVQKKVADNNWLAHEFFGGKNEYRKASRAEIDWAENIYARLADKYGNFLYARIDGISDGQKLRLLECELIVPRLFLREGQAFEKYALAIKQAC